MNLKEVIFILFIIFFDFLVTGYETGETSESSPVLQRIPRHSTFSTHRHQSECGFRCGDGTCIKGQNRCDGTVNCHDSSDELSCTCKDRIGSQKICDGIKDCPLGEDEVGCDLGCKSDEISCSTTTGSYSSHCIKVSQRCDGNVDCFPTHSDEKDCFRLVSLEPKIRGVVTTGIMQKRIGNEWFTICKASGWTESQLRERYARKTCEILVGDLLEDPVLKTVSTKTLDADLTKAYTFLADRESKFNSSVKSCPLGKVYEVTCPDPECGWPVNKSEKPSASESHIRDRRTSDFNELGLTAKIVGGQDSQLGDWPFIVGIFRNGSFHCGGSILNKDWILTAAHCTHGFDRYVYEAQVGMLRRHSYSPKEQTRLITEVHVHQRYDSKIFMNDIALMKVESPFLLSKWVTTACVATNVKEDPVEGEECTVIGWGDLQEDGSGPDHLQEVKLPVLRQCRETFTKDAYQICAGVLEGGKDACQGDSGGPLICPNKEGRLIVHGLVSFGRGCARPDQAGVYTRVSAYIPWIEDTMSEKYPLTKHPRSCPHKCSRDGGECLFPKFRCDGVIHCLNGEDEQSCTYRSRAMTTNDDADEEAYNDIKRTAHADEEHTHEYGSAKLCGPTEYQCKTTLSCIPLNRRCDGHYDCKDNTDEKHCACKDIVQNAFPSLVCNLFHECQDGSDEADCDGKVCEKDQVRCPLSTKCIAKTSWCDGSVDCNYGEDEVDCVRLMKTRGQLPEQNGFFEDKTSRSLQFGYVIKRKSGLEWEVTCDTDFGSSAVTVCPYLGLTASAPVITRNARATTCHQAKVVCTGERNCGQRKLYSQSQDTPGSKQIGAYPWVAMVLVEGDLVCPATVVHKQWLLVSSKCIHENVRSTSTQYLSAITGFSETTGVVSSKMEQVKRINGIVKLSDSLSLLKLESSLAIDHFTAPICTAISDKLDDTKCFRVKLLNGTLYDRRVHHDQSCHSKGHPCLSFPENKCKRSTEYFVYCTNDDTSWFLLGYATSHNVEKCSNNGQLTLENPFFGTHGEETQQILHRPVSSVFKPPGCTGTRCEIGTCVGNKYVCDGIAHCPSNIDEKRCQRHYQRLLRSHDVDDDDSYVDNSHELKNCPVGHFRCRVTGNCVPISAFCDGSYDCGTDDLTDEPEPELCNCRHYLQLAAPESICNPNGFSRCPDRSDQLGCPCGPDSFVCNLRSVGPKECIHKNLVCDGVQDCSNGLDEEACITLSSSLKYVNSNRTGQILEGYALVRVKGSWHPYCSDMWSNELGENICKSVGYPQLLDLNIVELSDLNRHDVQGESADFDDGSVKFWILKSMSANDVGPLEQDIYETNLESNYNCNVAYIKCSKP